MNPVHAHLLLNHVPLVGIAFGCLLLVFGHLHKSEEIVKAGLALFAVCALIALPVYFSGEGAEEIVERLPEVSESLIGNHEEAALPALIVTEILGTIAVGGLLLFRVPKILPKAYIVFSLVLALVSLRLLARAANLGGQIRHSEIRSPHVLNTGGGEERE